MHHLEKINPWHKTEANPIWPMPWTSTILKTIFLGGLRLPRSLVIPPSRSLFIFALLSALGIVNGYQLLCYAHTVATQYRGIASLFLFYGLSSFSAVSFCMFVILTVLFLFLDASIVWAYNQRGQLMYSCDSLTGHLSVHTLSIKIMTLYLKV